MSNKPKQVKRRNGENYTKLSARVDQIEASLGNVITGVDKLVSAFIGPEGGSQADPDGVKALQTFERYERAGQGGGMVANAAIKILADRLNMSEAEARKYALDSMAG